MPTLDDTPTLDQLVAVSPQDSLLVSEKGGSGSSLVRRIPAALTNLGFTHAWVVNYDNSTIAADTDTTADVPLHTRTTTEKISNMWVICTEAFTKAAGAAFTTYKIDIGDTTDGDRDNFIDDFDAKVVNSIAQNTGGSIGGSAAVALAGDIVLRVTANGANLDDTAAAAGATGQVVVLATIYDVADFKDIVSAT
jgi:hypothetical protein